MFQHLKYKSHEAQRDELFNAFAEQIQQNSGPLIQDTMEGCLDDEWSDWKVPFGFTHFLVILLLHYISLIETDRLSIKSKVKCQGIPVET